MTDTQLILLRGKDQTKNFLKGSQISVFHFFYSLACSKKKEVGWFFCVSFFFSF